MVPEWLQALCSGFITVSSIGIVWWSINEILGAHPRQKRRAESKALLDAQRRELERVTKEVLGVRKEIQSWPSQKPAEAWELCIGCGDLWLPRGMAWTDDGDYLCVNCRKAEQDTEREITGEPEGISVVDATLAEMQKSEEIAEERRRRWSAEKNAEEQRRQMLSNVDESYWKALGEQAAVILAEGGIPTWPGIGGDPNGERRFDNQGFEELRGDDVTLGWYPTPENTICAEELYDGWIVRYPNGIARKMTKEQFDAEFVRLDDHERN